MKLRGAKCRRCGRRKLYEIDDDPFVAEICAAVALSVNICADCAGPCNVLDDRPMSYKREPSGIFARKGGR